jgi:hypothetical protein
LKGLAEDVQFENQQGPEPAQADTVQHMSKPLTMRQNVLLTIKVFVIAGLVLAAIAGLDWVTR